MNERIKELNLQAMSIVMNGNDPDGDIEQMYIPSEFTKKFAELIVRECQHQVEQYIYECGEIASIPDTVIMKHFGVEQ